MRAGFDLAGLLARQALGGIAIAAGSEIALAAVVRLRGDAAVALVVTAVLPVGTPAQVIAQMRRLKDEWSFEFPDRFEAVTRRLVQQRLVRVGVKDGPGWAIKVDGKRYPVYARDNRSAGRWRALASGDEFRREVLRNGHPGVSVAVSLSRLHVAVDNTKKDEKP